MNHMNEYCVPGHNLLVIFCDFFPLISGDACIASSSSEENLSKIAAQIAFI